MAEDPLEGPRFSVLVADDHPLYREGVMRAVEAAEDLEVVGGAGDGVSALQQIRELRPDVAVLDLRMPGLDGIGIVQAVRSEGLPTRIVLLSAQSDGELVFAGLAAGADAYLSKDTGRDEICRAVSRVARGEHHLSPDVQSGLFRAIQARGDAAGALLTEREREILALIAEGKTGAEIGKLLHVSAGTVKSHLQHVYEKLGVSDRAAAVAEAMRRGLLT
jgi:two-component system, NarL family, nitrate/nitrite response regulator NarL